MRRLLSFLCALIALSTSSAHAEVGTLYVKNNTSTRADLWVNGQYQGYIPGGKTAYVPKDGFVTPESGKDGKGVEESHGGWLSHDAIDVRVQISDDKGKRAEVKLSVDGDKDKNAMVWVGSTDPGAELTDIDRENAIKLVKGGAQSIKATDILSADYKPKASGAVGTWVNNENVTLVINKDGSVTLKENPGSEKALASGKLNGDGKTINWDDGDSTRITVDGDALKQITASSESLFRRKKTD